MVDFILIANPISGKGRAKTIAEQAYAAITEAGQIGTLVLTSGTGDAERFAHDAVNAGTRKVIACGGDGTLHEVVNGIAEGKGTILGVLPCGRGNDFAAAIGVPRKPQAAIQCLLNGKPTQVDLGKITPLNDACTPTSGGKRMLGRGPVPRDASDNTALLQSAPTVIGATKTRYFITIATCGYDAEVSRRGAERSGLFKGFKGTAAYVSAAIATLSDYQCPYIKLEGDFGTLEGNHLLAATGITPRYGGGFRIVPKARYDDGLFDVCSIRAVSKFTILRLLVTLFWGGHVSHPAVAIHPTRALRIETEPTMLLYADGEPMCETPATLEMVKHGLSVIR